MKLINIYKQILKENELNQKFDSIDKFNEYGLAEVKLNNKYNFINREGKLISDIWFDDIYDFNEYGTARVELNNKYNHINKEGKLLFNWYDYIDINYTDNLLKVYLINKGWNFINKEGKLLSDNWFDYNFMTYFNKYGIAIIQRDKDYKRNFINTKGEILSDIWFDNLYEFNNDGNSSKFNDVNIAKGVLNDKEYFINTKGEILFNDLVEKGYNFVPVTEYKVIIINNDNTFKLLKIQ